MVGDFSNVSKKELQDLLVSINSEKELNLEQQKLLSYLNTNLPKFIRSANEKINSGKVSELTDLEKFVYKQEKVARSQKQQGKGEGQVFSIDQENLRQFQHERQQAGFEINHITDIHNTTQNLERTLLNNLLSANHLESDENGKINLKSLGLNQNFKLKDKVSIAITGDFGTDFFDRQNHGLEAFLVKTINSKAGWSKKEEEEFKSHYLDLMGMAGLDESMIEEGNPSLHGENSPLQTFYAYLFGAVDPNFLTEDDKEEFKKKRKKVQNLLKKGMQNHARIQYGEIKEIFDKYGLGPDKVAIVSGNHDLPQVMDEILGGYLVKPGQVREVSGVKFGNVVDSANGNFTGGPDFNDIFGYAGLREQLDNVRYDSAPHKKIKKILNDELGLKIDDRQIKRYMDVSLQRAAQGLGSGALGSYFKENIKPVLEEYIENRVAGLKNNLPKNADIILQHSMLDHPQRAGIEERAAHDLINKEMPGAVVIHGHEHAATPHRRDSVLHLNPGSAAAGSKAIHLLDKNKKYHSSLFSGIDDNLQETFRYMDKNQIPGQSSGKYGGQ